MYRSPVALRTGAPESMSNKSSTDDVADPNSSRSKYLKEFASEADNSKGIGEGAGEASGDRGGWMPPLCLVLWSKHKLSTSKSTSKELWCQILLAFSWNCWDAHETSRRDSVDLLDSLVICSRINNGKASMAKVSLGEDALNCHSWVEPGGVKSRSTSCELRSTLRLFLGIPPGICLARLL